MSDFLVYGSVAWDAPWLTEHNLAHGLAANGNRVLFVEPPISLAAPIRTPRGGAARLLRRRVRAAGDIAVVQPLALPPVSNSRARRLSVPLRRHSVGAALKRLGMERPVTIATRDVATMHVFENALRIYLVKDWIQAGGALLGRDKDALAGEVSAMATWADMVCAISRQLQEGLAAEGIESSLLRHGFHADLCHLYENVQTPDDLAQLPRPWLGYAGRIDARLDVDVLALLADRFSTGTLVLLGPVSPRFPKAEYERLRNKPNVAFLGARSREELPSYLTSFDCALMPYRRSEWTEYGSPLKLWDLLYAGPPIVGAGCLALHDYAPEHLAFADDPQSFAGAVEQALRRGTEGAGARRRYALANAWSSRARELELMIGAATGNSQPVPTSS